jgi:hypothetical protein
MSREPLSDFLMSDIGYLIESNRRTAWDKLHITQLLPTRYSINITNAFGRYQYNKQCMYVYEADFWLNIHLMYSRIRQIMDQIFSGCMQGSGRLLTKYSFHVCRGQADVRPNIHSVYAGIRQITDWIFIWCIVFWRITDQIFIPWMPGSGGCLTKYSFSVCRD